jgi:hypothetical protein
MSYAEHDANLERHCAKKGKKQFTTKEKRCSAQKGEKSTAARTGGKQQKMPLMKIKTTADMPLVGIETLIQRRHSVDCNVTGMRSDDMYEERKK